MHALYGIGQDTRTIRLANPVSSATANAINTGSVGDPPGQPQQVRAPLALSTGNDYISVCACYDSGPPALHCSMAKSCKAMIMRTSKSLHPRGQVCSSLKSCNTGCAKDLKTENSCVGDRGPGQNMNRVLSGECCKQTNLRASAI